MSKKIDMINRRFSRLVVIKEVDPYTKPSGQKTTMYECICDCGNYTIVSGTHLRNGHVQSCGCLKEEQERHGNTRLAHIWRNMIARCYNPNSKSYKNYGAKGITVCDSWKNDFKIFEKWAYKNDYSDNLTLDRIDNSKGYEPINCRWVSYKKQNNNRTNNVLWDYKGETHTISEWADITRISVKKLYNRRAKGWNIDRILETK